MYADTIRAQGWVLSGKCSWVCKILNDKMPTKNEDVEVLQVTASKAKMRANQQYAKRSLKLEVEEWRKIILPPHKVEVAKNGKIQKK